MFNFFNFNLTLKFKSKEVIEFLREAGHLILNGLRHFSEFVLRSLILLIATIIIIGILYSVFKPFILDYLNDMHVKIPKSTLSPLMSEEPIPDKDYKSYPIETKDSKGRPLSMDVHLLSEIYKWACGSSMEIFISGEKKKVESLLTNYIPGARLEEAQLVVTLGSASHEGRNKEGQVRLAAERARTLSSVLSWKFTNVDIKGFNLGQHIGGRNSKCSESSAHERRIVVVKVLNAAPELLMNSTEFSSELKNQLLRLAQDPAEKFPVDIRLYSNFKDSTVKMLLAGYKAI
jgi:hypothetical protein